ncbi:hypothetical protein FACS1894123_00230 [Bacteroidia bacterium]|nr:hypothetical protein FACS1894123_00230 [Bacteroidia bacterium]
MLLLFSCSGPAIDNRYTVPAYEGLETKFQEIEDSDKIKAEQIVIDGRGGFPIDHFFKKIDYIKLETTDNNLIGEISQIVFTDNRIIVVDNEKAKSVFVFDMNGNYQFQVGRMGNGPGEYVSIKNVLFVPEKHQILIHDGPKKTVHHYLSMTGKYLYSERLPFDNWDFVYLESGNIAYRVHGMISPVTGKFRTNGLTVTDSENKVLYDAFTDLYNGRRFKWTMHHPLRKMLNTVFFSPNFSNIIYEVQDSMSIPKYYINIDKKYGMPLLNKNITGKRFEEYLQHHICFHGDFIELEDLTYLNISNPSGNPFSVYSHKKKETFMTTGKGQHHFYEFLLHKSPLSGYKDNTVVMGIDSYVLLGWKDAFYENEEKLYKNERYKDVLDDLYSELMDDSNPVLFFCRLNPDI